MQGICGLEIAPLIRVPRDPLAAAAMRERPVRQHPARADDPGNRAPRRGAGRGPVAAEPYPVVVDSGRARGGQASFEVTREGA